MAMRKVSEALVGAYAWDVYASNEMEQLIALTPVKEQQWVMTGINVVVTPLGLIITHEKQKWTPRDSQRFGILAQK